MHDPSLARRIGSPARLAVVISTYNRADLLERTLRSFLSQSIDISEFEVIVVDDGSSDHTQGVSASFAESLQLTYSYQRNAGLASARNHGVFLTRAPLLLFFDDDDRADSDLIAKHLAAHERYPEDHYAVLGHTALEDDIARDPLMRFVGETGGFLFSYGDIRDGDVLDFTYFWGGRTSCKRAFLLEHGIFNSVFRFGCEDIELAFRLAKHGLRVIYQRKAISVMMRRLTLEAFCDRLYRQGRSQTVFSRLHTEPAVRRWAEIDGAEEQWARVEPIYDSIIRAAAHLDRLARLKLQFGFEIEENEKALLYRGYRAALRAAKLKGIVEASRALMNGGSTEIDSATSAGAP